MNLNDITAEGFVNTDRLENTLMPMIHNIEPKLYTEGRSK